jgi:hypothetical protein
MKVSLPTIRLKQFGATTQKALANYNQMSTSSITVSVVIDLAPPNPDSDFLS